MITLLGIGPGDRNGLTAEAMTALEQADLLIGAARMLAQAPDTEAERVTAYKSDEVFAALTERRHERACVLYSGDPGFWSGAESLVRRLEKAGLPYRVLPGLSSVQVLAARLGRSWKDWVLASAHGQDGQVLARLKSGRPVFLLTGGPEGPAAVCRELVEAGLQDLTVTVAEDLSYPGETVTAGRAADFVRRTFRPLNVVLVEPARICPVPGPGIPDSGFIRGSVPMTKQEVRAVILSRLAVGPSDVCWDIGAGTGSVSVELALRAGEVQAVEYDPEACALIRKNREKFCAWNLFLTEGRAPEVLDSLPAPDAVFVGGSEGALRQILRKAAEKNPGVRLCVSAVTLETAAEAVDEMEEMGLEPEAVQLSVSRSRRAGEKHMLLAGNPVFLITGGNP